MAEMFLDRVDAGRRLADELRGRVAADTVVLAIARGGVPVGGEAALALGLLLDVVFPRKLPIPWNPEAGFGAVTSDGTIVLNDALVGEVGLTKSQVNAIAAEVRREIERAELALRRKWPEISVVGKEVVVVDDGLASGYTMLAAVQAARRSGARRNVAAVPVASEAAVRLIGGSADELVCLIESHNLPFAVADYYAVWHDVSDKEALEYLGKVQHSSRNR